MRPYAPWWTARPFPAQSSFWQTGDMRPAKRMTGPERKGWKYLIRLRDKNRAVAYGLKLPDTAQFDIPVQITLGLLTARHQDHRT